MGHVTWSRPFQGVCRP